VGKEKGRARRNFIEKEKFLVLANLAMVALHSLGKELLVLLEGLFVGERNTGDTLNRFVLAVTKPVCSRALYFVSYLPPGLLNSENTYFENGKRLDVSGVRDVRTTAQIDQRTAAIHGAEGAVRNTLVDKVLFILAVVEHFHEFFLGHFETFKRLLLLDDGAGKGLESLRVLLSHGLSIRCQRSVPGN
jgi:hypothetical protein